MRQTLRALQSAGAGLAGAAARAPSQKRPTQRPAVGGQQPQQRDNRAFAPDDDDDEADHWGGGDEVQSRGFDQYPDQPR